MSGANTKASKVERAIRRIGDLADQSAAVERLSNSLKITVETANRLEAENDRLRKYLGSELFARRQREMLIPTLEPRWGNTGALDGVGRPPTCSCPPGICTGSLVGVFRCRHCIAPR